MSDNTGTDSRHTVYAGLTVDVVENSIDRVTKMLAGISGGVYKAEIGRAHV